MDALLRSDSGEDGSSSSSSGGNGNSSGDGRRELEVADAGRLPMVEAVILEAMR